MTALTEVADRQALWSQTADSLKKSIERSRGIALLLSIAGALLATIASQLEKNPRLYVGIAGAVALAIVTIISGRLASSTDVARWVRARAASEALKRAAYRYAAGATPYDDPATRDDKLDQERGRIDDDVEDLAGVQVRVVGQGSAPRDRMTRAAYIDKRVTKQVEYYVDRAGKAAGKARSLRWIEFGLSALATVVTAAVGVAGKDALGFPFDVVALTAVLTTMAGAILAHIESSRYDFLVTSFRASARRLTDQKTKIRDFNGVSDADWSAFVDRCENILSEESNSWVAKWTKPSATGGASPKPAGQ
jgi:SMODS and SLOG-associating 2TM effector domain 1/Protein of unknown function (DUF4231)